MVDRRALLKGTASAMLAGAGVQQLLAAETAGGSGAVPTVGPVPTVDERLTTAAEQAPLAMQFRGTTAGECRQWQRDFSAKLRELLGPFDPPATWTSVLERTVKLPDHTREQRLLVASGLPPVPVYILLPPELKPGEKRPGIVALHGHGVGGHDTVAGRTDIPELKDEIASQQGDYGRQLASRGYVVAVPCMTPFGRRLSGDVSKRRKLIRDVDPCADTFVRLSMLGKLTIAENLRDIRWALAELCGRIEVDPDRIGCVGLSYGGRMTTLATALEPKFRLAVIAGAMNCLQERIGRHFDCGSQTIPGLLRLGDVPEIGGLIAPRPCLWQVGLQDTLLPAEWVARSQERVERVYRALGAADRVQVDRFSGRHQWHAVTANPFLDQVLKPPA